MRLAEQSNPVPRRNQTATGRHNCASTTVECQGGYSSLAGSATGRREPERLLAGVVPAPPLRGLVGRPAAEVAPRRRPQRPPRPLSGSALEQGKSEVRAARAPRSAAEFASSIEERSSETSTGAVATTERRAPGRPRARGRRARIEEMSGSRPAHRRGQGAPPGAAGASSAGVRNEDHVIQRS
jgi:hypothetical protein